MAAFSVTVRRLSAAVATMAALALASAAPAVAGPSFHDGSGIHVVGSQALDTRVDARDVHLIYQ